MRRTMTVALPAAALAVALGTGVGVASATTATATPIRFAPGGTSATVSGSLARGGEHDYTFRARRGQTATVSFHRSNGTERWALVDPQGQPLHNGMTEQQSRGNVTLPATGTYRLEVQTTDPGGYSLSLTIPAH